ncbi:MAG: dockerin type I domain-containing protein, partial [Clostridiales bacterium]|nr:dockerin type I domain-containing protein [Clostridiales bacterium]
SYLFYGCENLTELDMTGFDTSSVTAMKNIFTGCYSLRKITVSERFSFCGAGSTRLASFPYVQRLIYGSSGIWADIDTGDEYSYNEIPDYMAATYYAKADRTQRFTESDFSIAETMYYMGEAVEPDVDTYLLHGTEYMISCENNVECGTATVTVTGVGNFVGSGFQTTFEIIEKPVQTVAYLLGDADGDGSVTVRDVTWMARSLAGVDIPYEFDSMTWDVDGDGELTVRDVTHLARYVSGVDEGLGIGEIYMVEK